jgi:hypothetical protein
VAFYSEARRVVTEKTPFPYTPAQHAGLLHQLKSQGRVTVARILPEPVGWTEQCWEPWELEAVLVRAEGQSDTYLSQSRFRGNRRAVARVLKLCCLFADLDYYTVAELRDLQPEAVLEKTLDWLREEGVPDPSLALSSGRGLTLFWRHTLVSRKRLAEWNAAQNRIYRVLKPFDADPKARDAARVLRITGTTNSKNGATVRALGDASEKTYRFEDLVEALVMNPARQDEEEHGKPGADLYSLAVQRAARGLRNHPQGWSEASLWEGRLTDLQHLRRMRYGEGTMEDFRDRWLFIATTAISWIVVPEVLEHQSSSAVSSKSWSLMAGAKPGFRHFLASASCRVGAILNYSTDALDREALALAEEAGGWDERRTRSDLSQILKRARRAAKGETIEFMGREWDPRHHFRNETIIDRLEITPEEEREMVVTISAEEASRRKRLRDREYQKRRRRAKGVASRPQYDENRTSSFRKRVAAARQLKNCGLSTEQIAERMNVSRRTVQRWLP